MGRLLLVAALAALAACGRVGFDAPGDASGDTGGGGSGQCAGRTFTTPPMSSLVDDFSTMPLALPAWVVPTPCIAQSAGSLVATPPSAPTTYCLAFEQLDYHLTCDSLTFEVPTTTNPVVGVQTVVYIDDTNENRVLSVILEGAEFQWSGTGAILDLGPYDAAADRWWRLRERDGVVYFETSADGVAFTTRGSMPDPASLDAVHPALGAGTYRSVATPGTAAFRCLGLAPPCS